MSVLGADRSDTALRNSPQNRHFVAATRIISPQDGQTFESREFTAELGLCDSDDGGRVVSASVETSDALRAVCAVGS
jgi:hypothetical protein